MIGLLPTLRLPWQHKPAPPPRWTPPTHQRPLIRHIRRCWACGRVGVSFCPDQCLPYTGRNAVPVWIPATPDPVEEAADARIAAVLDAEETAA